MQRLGNEVLGIDIDASEVNELIDDVSHAVIADVTDIETLKELNTDGHANRSSHELSARQTIS